MNTPHDTAPADLPLGGHAGAVDQQTLAGERFVLRYAAAMLTAWGRFQDERFGARAQALAYGALTSIIPLLGTAIAVLGVVLRDDDTRRRATNALIEALAVTTARTAFVRDLAENFAASSAAAGPVSLLVSLWVVTRTFMGVRLALQDAWRIETAHRPFRRRLAETGILVAVLVLWLGATAAGLVFGALLALGPRQFGPDTTEVRLLLGAGGLLLALALSVAGCVLIYRLVPLNGQSWHAALVGGASAGAGLEALRIGFTVFVTRFAAANPIYGALTSVFLFVTWANWATCVLLLGALLSAVWDQSDAGHALAPVRLAWRGGRKGRGHRA